jgi:hypothetical protein
MKFLIKPVVYVVGLLLASALILYVEALRPSDFGFYRDIFKKELIIERSAEYPLRKPAEKLTDKELDEAAIAWKYFVNNYQPETGFVNSVDQFPSTTFWDLSSYLHALISAYELGLIDKPEYGQKLEKCLTSIANLPLYQDKLPNKVYHTISLQKMNYKNEPAAEGVGWSAMDIGRFYSVVIRIMHSYPEYTGLMKQAVDRWDLNSMIINGTLNGIGFSFKDKDERVVQEGKLGYEEYCAKGLMMAGYDVSEAMSYIDFIRFIKINGVEVATDTREVKYAPAYNYVLSEPYLMDGLEYGFDVNSLELAYRIFSAQKRESKKTGKLIAVSEDHTDGPPYFVYNTVYGNGKKWNCIAENGDEVPQFKMISTKTAFGWYSLFDDPYSETLYKAVKDLNDPLRGWYAGQYIESGKVNTALTANTNGMILESLLYRKKGKLIKF